MRYLFNVLFVVAVAVFLSACGGSKPIEKTSEGDMPDWYLNPPKSNEYLYAAGVGVSADLSLAKRKGETDARATMARQISARVSDIGKKFAEEISAGPEGSKYQEMYTSATKEVADETLNACVVDKVSQPVRDGGNYRLYVLVRLPIGEQAQKMVQAISKNKELEIRFRASEAFKDLNKEVEDLRKLRGETPQQ